jgi:hypothetical protein
MCGHFLNNGLVRLSSMSAITLLAGSIPAFAGAPVPAPLAGLAGPYGLIAAAAVLGTYRLIKYIRKEP